LRSFVTIPQLSLKCSGIFLICTLLCLALPSESKEQIQVTPLILQDHVLNDRIYDVKNNRLINKSELPGSISSSKYILLGETHDNIQHHLNQTWIIDALAKQSFSTSVSFEMIDNTQAGFIASKNIETSNELIELLNHFKTGWEYEAYYKGLFDSVLQAGYRIYPANIERQQLYNIIQKKKSELPIETEQLMSAVSLTHEMEDSLQKEIVESHCGMIDQESAKPMMQGQQIRDATMALSLLKSDADKRVLIAGLGHVRKDRGVPIYLSTQDMEDNIMVIALIEVEQGLIDIASYTTHWNGKAFPFDYIWFTARANREDPCLFFKKHKK
jgi:uncharacterized iron-regulated protein